MRRLLPVFFALLLAITASGAGDTTRAYNVPFQGDTARRVDLFKGISWNVLVTIEEGKSVLLVTKQPDTLFHSKLRKARMWASVHIPRVLLHEQLLLHFELEGSLLLKQNGRVTLSTGRFQNNTNSDLRHLTQDNYRPLFLDDTLLQLDIIYLPRPQLRNFELSLELFPRAQGERKLQAHIDDERDSYGKGLYYFAFSIVFFVFYIYFRQKTENLYFSLFCFFAAYAFLWDEVYHDALFNMEGFPGIFSFEFLSIFFCKVLKNRERSRIPLLLITALALISLLPAVRYNYGGWRQISFPWILGIIYGGLYAFVTGSSVYYLISGLGQKRWEAKTVLIFCLAPVAVLLTGFIGFIVTQSMIRYTVTSNTIFVQFLDYFSSLIVYLYPLAAIFILGKRNGLNQKQLMEQVVSIRQLSEENLRTEQEKKQILERQNESLEHEVAIRTAEVVAQKEKIEKQHDELKEEKKKSDDLLCNILPEEIAEELKQKGHSDARLFDNVTVLFADFVDFTKAGESMTPQTLVNELHACFKAFDEIIGRYQIEKIKTIGDAYLAVCGLPMPVADHAAQIVQAAIEIRDFMAARHAAKGAATFEIRIGIHSGPVVAGIVGVKKFAYDIWGDTVNTAARMEQNSTAGFVNLSEATYQLVKDNFACTFRGDIHAKNKGALKMYFAEPLPSSAS